MSLLLWSKYQDLFGVCFSIPINHKRLNVGLLALKLFKHLNGILDNLIQCPSSEEERKTIKTFSSLFAFYNLKPRF